MLILGLLHELLLILLLLFAVVAVVVEDEDWCVLLLDGSEDLLSPRRQFISRGCGVCFWMWIAIGDCSLLIMVWGAEGLTEWYCCFFFDPIGSS